MGGLIELILENPLLIMVLLGGLFSLLRGKSDQSEEENQPAPNRPKPKQAESRLERRQTSDRVPTVETVKVEPIQTKSIEELREEQMLRFSTQTNSDEDLQVTDLSRSSESVRKKDVPMRAANHQTKSFNKNFAKSLTKEGLVNSVIMAEVLGRPRAGKSYQTIVTKRRNR